MKKVKLKIILLLRFISDSKIIINKYYNLDKINFAFDINGKNFDFKDIDLNLIKYLFSDGINTQF